MRHHAFRDVRRDVLALYKVSVQVFDHTRSRSSDRCVLSSFDSVRNGHSFEHMHARTAPHAIPCLHGHPQLHSCVPSLPSAVTIKRNLESILEATTRSRQHSFAPSPTASSRPRLSSRADPDSMSKPGASSATKSGGVSGTSKLQALYKRWCSSCGELEPQAARAGDATSNAASAATRDAAGTPSSQGCGGAALCQRQQLPVCAALRRSRAPGLRRATAHAAANV